VLHRFGITLVALTLGAPCALAFGDDGKKDSVEGKLLEILRSRQVINDAEFGELTALSARLRSEEPAAIAAPSSSFAASIRAAAGEGFTIEEGSFKLTVRNKFQTRFTYTDFDTSSDTASFSVPRARTYFDGTVFDPDITWRISVQYTEAVPVKDAWVNWNVWTQESSHSSIGLRMGQQKTRFGRLATASSFNQEFVDRDIASSSFSGGRSRGFLAHGEHIDGGKLHWHAGLFNSDTAGASPFAGEEAGNPDNELDYSFGVRFDPMGDMGGEGYQAADLERTPNLKASVGGNLWLGNESVTIGPVTNDNEVISLNLNGAVKVQGFHALGEVFIREDDVQNVTGGKLNSKGWTIQGTYTLAPNAKGHQIGFGGRYSMVELEDPIPPGLGGPVVGGLAQGEVTDITLVVSDYYKAHNLKTQLDFTFRSIEPNSSLGIGDSDDMILRLQFTMQI
jgi:hypothetical protein